MMNEICANCGREKSKHNLLNDKIVCRADVEVKMYVVGHFVYSGRVAVPVEFIEAVRQALRDASDCIPSDGIMALSFWESKGVVDNMLDQIEKE